MATERLVPRVDQLSSLVTATESGAQEESAHTWADLSNALGAVDGPAAPREWLIGDRPRPRALVVGDVPTGVTEVVQALAPTSAVVQDVSGIDLDEWDLFVTDGRRIEASYSVIAFVPAIGGRHDYRKATHQGSVGTVDCYMANSKTNTFRPPATDLPGPIRQLVEQTLIPLYRNDPQRCSYYTSRIGVFVPLAETGRGQCMAAIYSYDMVGRNLRVILPDEISKPGEWVRDLLLHVFRAAKPDTFSGLRDWSSDDRWLIGQERVASVAIGEFEARRLDALRQLDDEQRDLKERLGAAHQLARDGRRRLLVAQGAELVAAVIEALTSVGFTVVNVDEQLEDGSKKLEDLQVTDPGEDPDWIALTEVRGYGKGAPVSDLARIERFTTYFLEREHRRPSRRWYIVNHFLQITPGQREQPLASEAPALAEFAGSSGAVIDTRELFTLAEHLHGVDGERLAAVRKRFRQCTGRVLASDLLDDY